VQVLPDKNDGNSIVQNTLAKHEGIEININMEIVEDGEHSHY